MEFDFFIGGIEDGIIQVLQAAYGAAGEGYLKDIGSYGGELDEKTLRAFISELAPRFPLMLVAYGAGNDTLSPATSPALGEPRIYRHDCTFSVICCASDARSEKVRRRGATGGDGVGVYEMIADVRRALAGLRLTKDEQVLTLDPLRLSGVRALARLPELTAYAAHFDTYFKYVEPDRRGATHAVTEFDFSVASNDHAKESGRLPGVVIE
jgi:hypothetical protein